MKKYGIIKTVLFVMCIVAVLVIPQRINAEDLYITWSDRQTETAMTVEAGSQFYIGDFIEVLSKNTHATASIVGASYVSSDKKAATVTKKGLVKAKKEGITDITVVCKGVTLTCQLSVEPKKSIGKTAESKKLQAAVKTLAKKMPTKKLTSKNAFNFIRKFRAFMTTYYNNSVRKLSYDGFLYENERPASGDLDESRSEVLAVPEASRFWTANALVRQYQLDNDPTAIDSKKAFKIKKASASSKTGKITVELTKKVTADQILGAQLVFSDFNAIAENKNKAEIRVSVYDESKRAYYIGQMSLKKGSKKFTIQPVIYDGFQYKDVELTEGHVYRIGNSENWAGGIKVTATAKAEKQKKNKKKK